MADLPVSKAELLSLADQWDSEADALNIYPDKVGTFNALVNLTMRSALYECADGLRFALGVEK